MQLGMIGLGRMGANMARRLAAGKHECIGHDLDGDNVSALQREGMRATTSLDEFVSWQQSIGRHGLAGLRATRNQDDRARSGAAAKADPVPLITDYAL